MRRIRRLLAWSLVLVVGTIAAVFAWAQSPDGRARIARFAEAQLAEAGQPARIEGLTGLLPFDVQIGRLALTDGNSSWLEAEGLRLELEPLPLFAGELRIRALTAKRLALERLPPTGREAAPATTLDLTALRLPESLPLVPLDRLLIERLELGAAVAGAPATLRLEGRLALDDEAQRGALALALTRLDREGTRARLEVEADLTAPRLRLVLTASDGTGLLAGILGRPELRGLQLRLEGGGPAQELAFALRASTPALGEARGDLTLALGAEPALALTARLTPRAGLPPAWRERLGTGFELDLRLRAPAPGRLALERLRLASALARAEGAGEVDLTQGYLRGRLTATIPDLAPLAPLVGAPLGGRLSLEAVATARDRARLTLTGEDMVLDRLQLAGLRGQGEFRLVSRSGALEELELTGALELAAVTAPLGPLASGPDLRLRFDAGIPREGPLTLRQLELQGAGLDLRLAGELQPDLARARAEFDGEIADLADFLNTFGEAVPDRLRAGGRATLAGQLRMEDGFTRLEVPLQLALADLDPAEPRLTPLLGPTPTLRTTLSWDGILRLRDLELQAAAGRITGDLTWAPEDGALAGTLALDLPELSALAPLVASELSGRLAGTLAFGGRLTTPELRLRLEAAPLNVAGTELARARLAGELAATGGGLAGWVDLQLVRDGAPLTLTARGQLAEGVLALEQLDLAGPGGLQGKGVLRLPLANLVPEGRLELEVTELDPLRPWHRQELAGRARLLVTATAAEGEARLDLELEASGLAGAFGRLERLTALARIEPLTPRPTLDLRLRAESLARDDVRLATLNLDARGPLDELGWRLEATGDVRGPLALRAEGDLAWRPPALELVAERLDGRWTGRPLRLKKPLRARLAGGVLEIPEIELELGKARARGELQLGPSKSRARLEGEVPLSLLAALGGPRLAGQARLRLRLDGPSRAPAGELALTATGLRPADPLLGPLPPADVTLNATLARRRLSLQGRVRKAGGESARIEGTVPLILDLTTPELTLDPAGELALRLDARANLATLISLLAIDQLVATGRLEAYLALAGTPARPEVAGTLRLADGRIEEERTGLVLTGLELAARAADGVLVIDRLRARDGARGRLEASGELRLPDDLPGPAARGYGKLNLRNFLLFDQPLGRAVVDADLELALAPGELRIGGRMRVDRAVLDLARVDLGAAIPELAVLERDAAGRLHPAATIAPEAGDRRRFRILHELVIEVPGRLWVRGRGLESTWGGRLQVAGSPPDVSLVGTLELVRGRLDLLGRRLELVAGRLLFAGALPPEPQIEVEAVAQRDGVRAIARLRGPLTQPRLELASEPPLPEDEILARLLFARSRGQLTPMQGVRLAAALERLRGGGLDLLGEVRDVLGLDTLDVGSAEQGGSYVAAGKYLNDEVWVELRRNLATGETRARVEVELGPQLDLGAETGPEGSGAELEWRYDY